MHEDQGEVKNYQSIPLINSVMVTATRTVLDELVERPDVDQVLLQANNSANTSDYPVLDDITEGLNVAILNVWGAGTTLMNYMISAGLVASYDEIPIEAYTPSASELEAYDLIFIWGFNQMANPWLMDTVLAECANSGQAIITMGGSNFFFTTASGPFMMEINPFLAAEAPVTYMGSLGDYDETSPLMESVVTLTDQFIFDLPVQENAVVHAYWDLGYPIIATNPDYPNVIGINGTADDAMMWGGDMMRLILNAAVYATSGGGDDSYQYLRGDANMFAGGWPPSE